MHESAMAIRINPDTGMLELNGQEFAPFSPDQFELRSADTTPQTRSARLALYMILTATGWLLAALFFCLWITVRHG